MYFGHVDAGDEGRIGDDKRVLVNRFGEGALGMDFFQGKHAK